MDIMNFSKANCKNCYKCVRSCPVKAIRYSDNQAKIVPERCIYCGICIAVCPQNARHLKSDLEVVLEKIAGGQEVVALLAPSFAGFFDHHDGFITALRMLGFSRVLEVAHGADKVTETYRNLLETGDYPYAISTCCPSVNFLIRKYHPDMTKYLLPVVSPMIALAKAVKAEKPEVYTVFVGPCLAKKKESLEEEYQGEVDAVLTFEEIMPYLENQGVQVEHLLGSAPDVLATLSGRRYPLSGGIGEGLKDTLDREGYDVISTHGMDHVEQILMDLEQGDLDKVYIELSACHESCLNGPCIPEDCGSLYKRKQRMLHYVRRNPQGEDTLHLDKAVSLHHRHLAAEGYAWQPKEESIRQVLRNMGKTTKADELNCGACGYNSCRAKARSVLEGMSEIEMCMPYMRMKAETMNDMIFLHSPNLIFLLDRDLDIQQANPAAMRLFAPQGEALEGLPLRYIMEDEAFQEALKAGKTYCTQRIHDKNRDKVFLENLILLEDTHQVILIVSDITEEEKRRAELRAMKEETLKVAQDVINKQMRISQEIASLLGETTAETKMALNALKQVVVKEGE
ncbi:4Fe-4S binding protein [Proteiniclasticum sp. BAD-10]|uniref:4Fe-4S binding protein n=1 Tax=Proteiniclasticum sediminis TaxID=2804028 RepID=A0A941HNX8_9CLOT|nr:[Fe-Fe] hydrogenase large subunit C-terminal domain-containing protein [Proteiniclasticum sediminis]MBR0574916.1 4Fe-4S binding protein [Proteiniclasticum sediminis]